MTESTPAVLFRSSRRSCSRGSVAGWSAFLRWSSACCSISSSARRAAAGPAPRPATAPAPAARPAPRAARRSAAPARRPSAWPGPSGLLLLVDLVELALVGLRRLLRHVDADQQRAVRADAEAGRHPVVRAAAPRCSSAARRCPAGRGRGRAPAARARRGTTSATSALGIGCAATNSRPALPAVRMVVLRRAVRSGRREPVDPVADDGRGAPGSSVIAAVDRDRDDERRGVAERRDERDVARRRATAARRSPSCRRTRPRRRTSRSRARSTPASSMPSRRCSRCRVTMNSA